MFFYIMLLSFIIGIISIFSAFKTNNVTIKVLCFVIGIVLIGYSIYLFWPHQVA